MSDIFLHLLGAATAGIAAYSIHRTAYNWGYSDGFRDCKKIDDAFRNVLFESALKDKSDEK